MTNKRLAAVAALLLVLGSAGCAFSGAAGGPGATPGSAGGADETALVDTTTMSENVEASGTVQAAQSAVLTWKISGIVEEVMVQPGDQVQSGDTLATLALTSVPANVLAAQADLINAEQTLENLSPSALAITQASQQVAQAQDAVKERQKIVDGLGTPASQGDIEQANASALLAKIQLDKAWDRYKPYQNKPEDNPIRAAFYNQWAQANQQYEAAVRRLNNLKGVTVNQTDLALAQANLELAQAQLTDAQENLADLKAGADPQDRAAAEARITAAQATLNALSITAPFAGEILVADLLPGDVVNSGQAAFTLADRDQLHVDTMIDESDIANVQPGDSVELSLDSLPGVVLTGKVDFINPLGQTVSGNVKFPVRIALDPLDQPVLLGATADIKIQTGAPRAMLSAPVRAIQSDDAGEFVVVLRADDSLERVDIVSGPLQGDRVIILSGDLQAGDRVQLALADNEMFNQMQQMQQR